MKSINLYSVIEYKNETNKKTKITKLLVFSSQIKFSEIDKMYKYLIFDLDKKDVNNIYFRIEIQYTKNEKKILNDICLFTETISDNFNNFTDVIYEIKKIADTLNKGKHFLCSVNNNVIFEVLNVSELDIEKITYSFISDMYNSISINKDNIQTIGYTIVTCEHVYDKTNEHFNEVIFFSK